LDFFDSETSEEGVCDGEAILFIPENHPFELQSSVGRGTNNYAGLLSIKLLLLFAIENDVHSLQKF